MSTIKQYKVCKRLGNGVFEKCQTQRFAMSEARGKKSFRRGKNMSDFGRQLIEKQKVRFAYGISEKQLVNYVRSAMKDPDPTRALYNALETRLDNTVYRCGFAPTRRAGRQMVGHGHITINGKKLDIPSHTINEKDVLSIRDGSKDSAMVAARAELLKSHTAPAWIALNAEKLSASIKGTPVWSAGEDALFDFPAVFEYYSR